MPDLSGYDRRAGQVRRLNEKEQFFLIRSVIRELHVYAKVFRLQRSDHLL
jgi:hypothetical protein